MYTREERAPVLDFDDDPLDDPVLGVEPPIDPPYREAREPDPDYRRQVRLDAEAASGALPLLGGLGLGGAQ